MKTEKEKEAIRKAASRKLRIRCLIRELEDRLNRVKHEISYQPSEEAFKERNELEKEIRALTAQYNTASIDADSDVLSDREILELAHGEKASDEDKAFFEEISNA